MYTEMTNPRRLKEYHLSMFPLFIKGIAPFQFPSDIAIFTSFIFATVGKHWNLR